MQILRKVANFGSPIEDMKLIYFSFIRSHLEKSATVWHSSLTDENKNDLERIQKTAMKIMLGNDYNGYKKSLEKLNMDTLDERRKILCLNFAVKCTKHEKLKNIFPERKFFHTMKKRNTEKYEVEHANTEKFRKSSVIFMQNLLNKNHRKMQKISEPL